MMLKKKLAAVGQALLMSRHLHIVPVLSNGTHSLRYISCISSHPGAIGCGCLLPDFFLLKLTPGSLRLAAIYQVSLSLTLIVLGATVGVWVDKTNRLTASTVSLVVQNVMVCVCATVLIILLNYPQSFALTWHGWAATVALVFAISSACVAQIGTLGCKLTLEKDWIVVICGSDERQLAVMNSVLRSVDLSTDIFAPVTVGFVMTAFGMTSGGITIAVWNVLSLILEYSLLRLLYNSVPGLRVPKVPHEQPPASTLDTHKHWCRWIKEKLSSALMAWNAYMKHEVRNAGLGLALLYMTVLAFDNYSRSLWMVDLSMTQTLQEKVSKDRRGAINGVQWSLNQMFDLLRSVILILLPTTKTFGLLIILSFTFVATGWILFSTYFCQVRRNQLAASPPEQVQLT